MIQKIQIRNFQKHKKKVLELDPRITVISGSSDKGKSAIIRALIWTLSNSPSGKEFIRHKSKGTSVALKIDDSVLTRKRTASKNEYKFDKQTFQSFGSSVPDPIKEFLCLDPEINFQSQHDSAFWFSESAGFVSKKLNQIVDLEIIDRMTSNAQKRVRRQSQEIEISEQRLKEAKAAEKELSWAKTCVLSFKPIEAEFTAITAAQDDIQELTDVIEDLETTENEIKRNKTVGSFSSSLEKIEENCDRLEKTEGSILKISSIMNNLERLELDFEGASEKLSDLEREFKKLMKNNCPLCGQKTNK